MRKKLIFKIILLGDEGVGKTSFRRRFIGTATDVHDFPELMADFYTVSRENGERSFIFQIWDLYTNKPIKKNFLDFINGILLIFDLTNLETLIRLPKWIELLQKSEIVNIPLVLIGSKADLINSEFPKIQHELETIKRDIAKFLKIKSEIPVFFTSAKTGLNIHESFNHIMNFYTESTL